MRPVDFENPEDLARHEDLAVRVWNSHLEGDGTTLISGLHDISRTTVRQILDAGPPALIAADLRYLTGQDAFFVSQANRDAVRAADGTAVSFIVILEPLKMTRTARDKGLRAVRRAIRADNRPGFDFLPISERASLASLLRMVHRRGYPAWEIDAAGEARPYDGRHAALVAFPEPEETDPSP